MKQYWRPIPSSDPARPADALPLAGGWLWFDRCELLQRDAPPRILPLSEVPADVRARLSAPRAPIAGLSMDRPHVMAILNTTPDSFSDGGSYDRLDLAEARARTLLDQCTLIDIGGESTRPGAPDVPVPEEIARTAPLVARLRAVGIDIPLSIDTRKAPVAAATLAAGAQSINDVSGFDHDPDMARVAAESGAPVCLMHMRGTPDSMNGLTDYDDVVLDIHDALEGMMHRAMAAGIAHERIILDPGIGFAKDHAQNLALIARLSILHDLGCPILLGVSRKRFIGEIARQTDPRARMPGSVAVALAGVAAGAQILRVHDAAETSQALRLWQAATSGQHAWD